MAPGLTTTIQRHDQAPRAGPSHRLRGQSSPTEPGREEPGGLKAPVGRGAGGAGCTLAAASAATVQLPGLSCSWTHTPPEPAGNTRISAPPNQGHGQRQEMRARRSSPRAPLSRPRLRVDLRPPAPPTPTLGLAPPGLTNPAPVTRGDGSGRRRVSAGSSPLRAPGVSPSRPARLLPASSHGKRPQPSPGGWGPGRPSEPERALQSRGWPSPRGSFSSSRPAPEHRPAHPRPAPRRGLAESGTFAASLEPLQETGAHRPTDATKVARRCSPLRPAQRRREPR